ncbi:MAG: BON domain-containing protein [Elusimicrobiota bacterium]|jgi:osmotically-inducible protein OsmY
MSLALFPLVLLGAACAFSRNSQKLDMSDSAVVARVRAEFKAHPEIDIRFLDVSADRGDVTVSGLADSWEERREIRAALRKVPGVKQITINIAVQDE